MPASSAPQRSQYHSVGRLSVPHSPHLSVLATPVAPTLPRPRLASCVATPPADPTGVASPAGGRGSRGGGGGAFFFLGRDRLEERHLVIRRGRTVGDLGSRTGALALGRAAAGDTGSGGGGSGSGSGATATGGGAGGSARFGVPLIRPCTSASLAISCPTPLSSPRSRPRRSLLSWLSATPSASEYSPTACRTSASESSSSTVRFSRSRPDWVLRWRSSSSLIVVAARAAARSRL